MHKINFALKILAVVFAVLVFSNPAMADEKLEIYIQMGHSFVITSVAFSPDGRYIASGSADKTIKLWEVSTSREIRTLLGHTSGVSSVAFSPDGRYIISGSWDKTIKLWDVATGREIRTLVGHSQQVTSAAFSPDGKYIASGSRDKTIRFWDVSTGREIRTLADHTKEVETVAFSPDGKYIASGSGDKTIKLWDVATGREIRTLVGHSQAVTSVAFSPDGRYIVSGSYHIVKLWEVSTARTLKTFTGSQRYQNKEIESVGFSRDGKYVLSASIRSLEENLQIWEVRTGRELKTFKNITIDLTAMDFSPDGKTVLTGTMDRSGYSLRLWDLSTGRALRKMGGNVNVGGNSVAFSPDGRYLLAEAPWGTLRLFDIRHAKKVMTYEEKGGHSGVNALTFSPDGKYFLASRWRRKAIEVREVSSGKRVSVFSGHKGDVGSVAISPDGKYALSSDYFLEMPGDLPKNSMDIYKRSLKLWDVSTGKLVRNLEISLSDKVVDEHYTRDDLSGAAFSANGKYAVAQLRGRGIIVWDVFSGRRLGGETRKYAPGFPVFGVPGSSRAYTPDGKYASSAGIVNGCISPDGKYKLSLPRSFRNENIMGLKVIPKHEHVTEPIYDSQMPDVATFTGHTCEIRSAVFSPDGTHAASGSYDGTTRLWDVNTGQEIAQFVSFTDGEWIIITPEGYFNASPSGAKHLNVRIGNNVYSIDNFYEKFFNPVYVASVLQGKKIEAVADIRKGFAMPPDVKIISPEPNATFSTDTISITVSAKDTGGGIDEIRLYHNGKAIGEDQRAVKIVPKGNEVTKTYTVTLVDGLNNFRAVGFSRDRTESNPYELLVKLTAPSKDVSLYVFAAGINKYKNPALNLNYAEPDARGIIDFFKQRGKGLFKKIEIVDIYNEQATKQGITSKLKQLQNTQPQDAVLIYLAGHGESLGDKWYFIPHEITYPEREEDVKTKGISSEELSGLMKDIKAQKILMLIDACKSGAVMIAFRGFEDRKALSQLSRSTGVHIIAASTKDQFAAEVKELGHGVFTHTLLEGLKGKASSRGKTVTVRKLMGYVEEQLPDITKKYKQEAQYPVVDSRGMDFPLVIVK